ncbi:hypothetical protein [Silvibacterium dinghuense]|uniref:VPEID-CTERM sorting domain-containing protein n=1 Tax=Silvibacterium dinghuense TaxID=1560006 RepID=A0A4Q1S863_9BACT|nr:hypothetical protein [Silvibacterium dinghuense]RXS93033.1 hypothetical protein ESZ00_19565 [Silvibacterium dinghuense]
MKRFLKPSLLALGLMLGASTAAHADPPWWQNPQPPTPTAPEIDPGLAVSGITLLAGTLTVFRARRRK